MLKIFRYIVLGFYLFTYLPPAVAEIEEISSIPVTLPSEMAAEQINVMMSDRTGLMWFGTQNGLFRWDGQRALKMQLPPGSASTNVTALAIDNKSVIYAGFDDGSICYSDGSLFQLIRLAVLTDSVPVSDLVFDQQNRLWCGTRGNGIFCFNENKMLNVSVENGLNDDYVYDLEPGTENEIWAATDNGIGICSLPAGEEKIAVKQLIDELPDIIVRVIRKDKNDNFWLGFQEGGICRYEQGKITQLDQTGQNALVFGQINSIQLENDKLWIADDENGLTKLPKTTPLKAFAVKWNGMQATEKVKSLLKDKLGNLWILTHKKLYVSNGGAFQLINEAGGYSLANLQAIVAVSTDHFWIANDNGVVEINKDQYRFFLQNKIDKTAKITSLTRDAQGRIWIATFGQGIVCLDPETGQHTFINEKQGLINDNVLNISSKDNTIWAATLGGASRIIMIEGKNKFPYEIVSFSKETGLGNNYIYSILQDKQDNVWFGTDGNGLVNYADGRFKVYDEQSGIGDDVVYSIAGDENENIWFSTANSGLYNFNGENFINYRTKDGLSGENIFSIICQNMHVFVLSEKGLDVFHKDKQTFINLNEELDLGEVASDLNSVSTFGNRIYFATQKGIITLNTDDFDDHTYEPVTLLDLVTVNQKPVNIKEVSNFTANENFFVFNYSGLWYQAPQRVQFQIQLKGYDRERKSTYDRMVSYSNLPPGEYTFEVSSFLGSPENKSSTASYRFVINKPFYQSFWFILFASVLFLFSIYYVVKLRERRFMLIEGRKKEKLEFEFQTLKNQINPHFLFNSFSTLISIIEEDPKKAVSYTESLSDFFRDILEVKDMETIPVKEEIRLINNYYFIQKQRFGDQFTLIIELDERAMQTSIPPLTLQLLTENAVKHNVISKTKPLAILIRNDRENIYVENNRNFKNTFEKSTGIGLQNIRDRYKLISGKEISIAETENSFIVILPLIS